jgi:hypothetical protein
MEFLNDHECEALSGGGYSLVLPNIGLNVITPLNLGVALGLLEGTASVDQGNMTNLNNLLLQALGGKFKM